MPLRNEFHFGMHVVFVGWDRRKNCLLARAAALPTYINDSGRAGRRVHGPALELRVGKQAGNIPRASSLNISPCVYAESGEAFPCTPGPLHKVGPETKINPRAPVDS